MAAAADFLKIVYPVIVLIIFAMGIQDKAKIAHPMMIAWETTVLTIRVANKHKVVLLKQKMEKAVLVILIASQDIASIVFVMEI